MSQSSATHRLPVRRYSASGRILADWQRMSRLWHRGLIGRFIARHIRGRIRRQYGCYLAPTSRVGEAVYLPHPVGVVVGDNAVIGNGVTIYQHVTIGQDGTAGRCPKIGDSVVIFAGAVVIGDIEIGEGAIIGANAVVKQSIPPGRVAVGVPARLLEISTQDHNHEFESSAREQRAVFPASCQETRIGASPPIIEKSMDDSILGLNSNKSV